MHGIVIVTGPMSGAYPTGTLTRVSTLFFYVKKNLIQHKYLLYVAFQMFP